MNKARSTISTALLIGVLCFNCDSEHTVKNPSFSIEWPLAGRISMENINGKLALLNALEGDVFILEINKKDSILNCYDPNSHFEPRSLFSFGDKIYLISDTSVQAVFPQREQAINLTSKSRYYRSNNLPTVSHGRSIYVKSGYYESNTFEAASLKAYGEKAAVWQLIFSEHNGKDALIETPIKVPIIPKQWNNGSYYGLNSFLTSYQDIGVYSYEKYPTTYLFNLSSGKLIDSISFLNLEAYGLKPMSESSTINEKKLYLTNQPKLSPSYLSGQKIYRTLASTETNLLLIYDLQSRQISSKDITTEKKISLYQHQDSLYTIEYSKRNGKQILDFIPFYPD